MPNVQQWGRKESIIWPPRGYLYTLGAFFLACVATGIFVYIRFQYGFAPLARYSVLPTVLSAERDRRPDASNEQLSTTLCLQRKGVWACGG